MPPFIFSLASEPDLDFWVDHYRLHTRFTPAVFAREQAVLACAVRVAHTTHSHVAGMFDADSGFEAVAAGVLRCLPNLSIRHSTGTSIPRFGEYDARENEIILYTRTLERFDAHLFSPRVPLAVVCLAHEFFHALEHNTTGDTRKHVRKALGWFPALRAKLYRHADEVAAHTFARRLLSLESMPVVRPAAAHLPQPQRLDTLYKESG